MPKRKSIGSAAATPASVKRQKQETPAASVVVQILTSSTRSSGRVKSQVTSRPAKAERKNGDAEEEVDDDESGYEDEDASMTEASESAAESEEYESEEEIKPKKKPKPRLKLEDASSDNEGDRIAGKQDLWREGVKTGLGPGKAVYIEKPKARGDGGIKFVPQKIHPNTLEFLRDLKKNNDRVWLKAHDADFRTGWKDWESFVEVLTEKIAEIDETIPELPPKDLVFRIYRDIRFSKDPTPYKPHFSAAWSRTGRKGPYACYYVQIQPN
ncbi:hypothetical protein LTR66_017800, partial [Elasticomyces elasticus]